MLVVRVDDVVKDGAKRRRLRRSAILDNIINTNTNAVQAIKAAFSALSIYMESWTAKPLGRNSIVSGRAPRALRRRNPGACKHRGVDRGRGGPQRFGKAVGELIERVVARVVAHEDAAIDRGRRRQRTVVPSFEPGRDAASRHQHDADAGGDGAAQRL